MTHQPLPLEAQDLLARIAIDAGMSLEQHNVVAYGSGDTKGATTEMMVLQYPPVGAPQLEGHENLGDTVRITVAMVSFADKRPRFHSVIQSGAAHQRNVFRGNSTNGSTLPKDMIKDMVIDSNPTQLARSMAGWLGAEKGTTLGFAAGRLNDVLLGERAAPTPLTPNEIKATVCRRVGYGEA